MLACQQGRLHDRAVQVPLGKVSDAVDLRIFQRVFKSIDDFHLKALGIVFRSGTNQIADINLLHVGMFFEQGHKIFRKIATSDDGYRQFLCHGESLLLP